MNGPFGGMNGNPLNMIQQFQNFVSNFQRTNQDPRQVVQDLLNNGKMTQQQYNKLSDMARSILNR